jgi:flagellar biosynthetic protein FliR
VFFMLLFTSFFLSVGGPEIVFLSLANSLSKVPLGTFDLYSINPDVFLKLFYESFSLAVRISLAHSSEHAPFKPNPCPTE